MEIKRSIKEIAFYLDNQKIAYVSFKKVDENTIDIIHTVVDEKMQGQGLASKLLDEAYSYLKGQNKKVLLSCSYAQKYFNKYTEKQDILK